ncbi:hypothetical protein MKW98_009393 [Papaver atlanticum]|uniref:Uncharacterized protein n=1 Tax=Papaver atlanticum TaxID=357466 RepID=A0AAD4RZ32_9MAGN|nr:hypothetical protein MKW98_009393 [Papaver atlanticum]
MDLHLEAYVTNKRVWRLIFTVIEWSGSLYVSPTIAGSKTGGLSTGPWAAMMSLGRKDKQVTLPAQGNCTCPINCPLRRRPTSGNNRILAHNRRFGCTIGS